MNKQVTIPFSAVVTLRDALGMARNSDVNAAYVCGQLHAYLTKAIERLEKEAKANEKTI